ncbi:MAG: hypothetical protein KGI27_10045 [Thaumarchaeota archaeon]|nr:hypothetical protein [Nitrososphaerota archaeon]
MQKEKVVREALSETSRELEHIEELRSMRNLNQGYSEIRNAALNEIERLVLEKRKVLLWMLKEEETATDQA